MALLHMFLLLHELLLLLHGVCLAISALMQQEPVVTAT
jgi:hypothetical protein